MTRLCMWAMCDRPAVETDDDGYEHCKPHWRDHLALLAEDAGRLCMVCGNAFQSRTGQRKKCDACRATRSHQLQPCGTRAAHKRHRSRGEEPCEACAAAERAYQAGRQSARRQDPVYAERQRERRRERRAAA